MRIMIIGASGQLGLELSRTLSNYDLIKTYTLHELSEGLRLNLMDYLSLEDFITKKKPEVIINTAAFTDVDRCEVEREKAFKINAEAVRHIVRASRVVEAYLIQISTDYVFDGNKGLYKEDDLPNPINYYGLTKLLGEKYALSYDDTVIVRTSGIFRNKGFPVYVYKSLKEGKEVLAFKGFYSPISAKKLAEVINELIIYKKTGVINIAGERISRYDLAQKIKELYNLSGKVIEVDSVEGWIAKRPFDSSLDISKAKKLVSIDFYSIDENLKHVVI
ncbi:MAG: NAD(P)-dependent oxidoreductase [Saccharolobus sp.]|uniref:dTDP-4-dehydrorhamnose reductase n=1 Tax=Saccharolobus shibatae (strain ATCC 51178 / DSM 5389 / JCM 8931 / NBRC 15437 / B12) TaxID=523848 RepID=A0A8F5BNT3_SACSH|nr:NAD(P)-dependent oxidoreductase [Saccharolobus shibatae]MCH4816147.1 NAD(P)-dependent oxidoreductase [Saccharolobus shibatae]QXJ28687.1 dTDP-4-dehydrorhamnose reductase [Saccharolobus shibatae B12]